jgi:hypothetical protein
MNSIQTITNIRIYRRKDGTLSRDLDRLKSHIYSIKKQIGGFDIDIVIGDSSYDDDIKDEIKKVCLDMGAQYVFNGALDLFNRGISINKTFLKYNKKTDFIVLFDLDHVIVDNLFEVFLKNTEEGKLLTCGIHFLTKSKIEFDEINPSLVKHLKRDELKRFGTAKGLQFWRYDDFVDYGGVDANFNLYCGTDDEILYRMDRSSNVNLPTEPMAFHINHEKMILPKYGDLCGRFCQINRYYLTRFTKSFKKQNNLTKDINYLCYDPKIHEIYWGTENNVLIDEENFIALSDVDIINLYLENRK